MRRVIIAIIFVIVAAAGTAMARSVTVVGTAGVAVTPDQVVWRVEIDGKDMNLHKAKRQCDERIDELLQALDQLRATPEDLKLGHSRISEVYKRNDEGVNLGLAHYKVERTLIILQRDTGRIEEFFDALMIERGLTAQMSFRYSRRAEEIDRMRVEALANARTKAEVLARIVDAELGQVLEISEFPLGAANRRYTEDSVRVREPGSRAALDPNEIRFDVRMYAIFELTDPVAATESE